MLIETKEMLFEELIDILTIMDCAGFGNNHKANRLTLNISKRFGKKRIKKILTKYNITTLYELDKNQIENEINLIHRKIVKGFIK